MQALAQYHSKGDRLPGKAKLVKVSANSFEIEYHVLRSLSEKPAAERVTVRFSKPLKSDSDARPAILALGREAEEKRNKNAAILFSPVNDIYLAFLFIGSWYILHNPALRDTVLPANVRDLILSKIGGVEGIKSLDWFMSVLGKIHAVEAGGMFVFNLRRGASLAIASKWAVSTFFAGFTAWLKFFRLNPLQPTEK